MKPMKEWDRIPERKDRKDMNHKRSRKMSRTSGTDEFQQSMREDMRGPMEGLEPVVPKK